MKQTKPDDEIDDVDICIPTFKRPKAIKRLLFSIAAHYPLAKIHVADQNETLDEEFYNQQRHQLREVGLINAVSIDHLSFDCGISYARNHLAMSSPSTYKLILDDDMVFASGTDIAKFVWLLRSHPRAGIVGGCVNESGANRHFECNLEKIGDTIAQVADGERFFVENGVRYKKTGCVLNFALMRKELFEYIRWDPALKMTEHADFYLRMKLVPYDIFYTPDVVIDHPPVEPDNDYETFRRRTEFMAYMLRKHNARKLKYLNGHVRELGPDGSIIKYQV